MKDKTKNNRVKAVAPVLASLEAVQPLTNEEPLPFATE